MLCGENFKPHHCKIRGANERMNRAHLLFVFGPSQASARHYSWKKRPAVFLSLEWCDVKKKKRVVMFPSIKECTMGSKPCGVYSWHANQVCECTLVFDKSRGHVGHVRVCLVAKDLDGDLCASNLGVLSSHAGLHSKAVKSGFCASVMRIAPLNMPPVEGTSLKTQPVMVWLKAAAP